MEARQVLIRTRIIVGGGNYALENGIIKKDEEEEEEWFDMPVSQEMTRYERIRKEEIDANKKGSSKVEIHNR
ncbi:hypothetical protein Phum_PHUM425330 [Pediculus humanus corporis]|uniref:Uncharacterized protein n=1 Tax=Pediculus humanus subsp. corporis TaxID=121224 RepID=E0VT21_PEDHC|nr:uncharacterized protein Phum_PHUM425330 [Pediculus humanus corporis]EEB16527.1 hypothetical protein Phum_PHUM425330 [Pediculus humanus corporis]